MVDSKIFGSRIRQARDRLRMSQDDLAEALGKDQRAISEYENGKRRVAAVDLAEFARVLQVPILFFFKDDWGGDTLEEAVLIEFHRLPSAFDKQSAIQILRVLADMVEQHLD